ncbi:MAG: site-specific DNA-methyltransferase [Candidatus Pacebacteria bacterium]|nr:site-specific DNA-methyltransferase [Candidatus Paceibacterota bacterium]
MLFDNIITGLNDVIFTTTDYGIIINDDCLQGLKKIKDDSVNVVITSPPYANKRKKAYGGIETVHYIEWFKPIAKELYRVLKKDGSFFLNIKGHPVGGIYNLYVFDLILTLYRELNFKLIDIFCWTKSGYPGNFKNRFKNAWEPIFHFAKSSDIAIYKSNVVQPMKKESLARAKRKYTGQTKNKSGLQCVCASKNMKNRKIAYPSNHLHIPNVLNQYSDNKWHPAVFRIEVPEFFIRAFSKENDIVLDPFMGSARTAIAAVWYKRNYIGFEINKEYFIKSSKSIETKTGLKSKVFGQQEVI